MCPDISSATQIQHGRLHYPYLPRTLHTISFVSHSTQGIATATTVIVGSPARTKIAVTAGESPSRALSNLSRVRVLNIVLNSVAPLLCLAPQNHMSISPFIRT